MRFSHRVIKYNLQMTMAVLASAVLAACGGSSSDPAPVLDTKAPVITLNGDSVMTFEHSMSYVEQGATAVDDVDGNVAVTISGEVDTLTLGNYTVTYTATDKSGNASSLSRIVNVVDTTAPTISLVGESRVSVEYGLQYVEQGATAVDSVDGDLNVVTSGSVDVSTLGEYRIDYQVSDHSGNTATDYRLVEVVDTTAPIIALNGDVSISILVGTADYVELGATAVDNFDGDIDVTIVGEVDSDKIDDYQITYTATDSSGNISTLTRTVSIRGPLPFITVWDTTGEGVSNDNQIFIDTFGDGYDYSIDWGDGSEDSGVTGDITHTYEMPGQYTVKITGNFPQLYMSPVEVRRSGSRNLLTFNSDNQKLMEVVQWGEVKWQSMFLAFNCTPVKITATDLPDLSSVETMKGMFSCVDQYHDHVHNDYARPDLSNSNIDQWNVSNVTDMSFLFSGLSEFNEDISRWDVSRVTNMRRLFELANSFDQNLAFWDVSSVTNMHRIFYFANSFNQDISGWNVANVNDMSYMFYYLPDFDQNLSDWDVSNVADMSFMFYRASSFNQDLSSWDVSNVSNMRYMFAYATAFDQNLENWQVSSIDFVQDFVIDFSVYYSGLEGFLREVTLSTSNYDALLISLSKQELRFDLSGDGSYSQEGFHGGNSKYSEAGAEARQYIIDTFLWQITDGGPVEE